MRYRIHISLWGVGETDAVRNASVLSQAMANYRDDRRVLCVFTISALNTGDIVAATRLAHENRLPITFSYFSPSMNYNAKLSAARTMTIRFSESAMRCTTPCWAGLKFCGGPAEIERAMALYPDTVLYSLHYDDWITQPDAELHDLDPETGIAQDCSAAEPPGELESGPDFQRYEVRCAADRLFLCRGYGPSYATYFRRRRVAASLLAGVDGWYETRRIWARLFLPEDGVSRAGTACEAGTDVPAFAMRQ